MDDLHTRGFLSSEVEVQRQRARQQYAKAFSESDGWSQKAVAQLRQTRLTGKSAAIVLGVGYWIRCVRACQGGILLAERGMAPDALTLARSAVESLFHAAALMVNPTLIDRLAEHDLAERKKQANGMMSLPEIKAMLSAADHERIAGLLRSGAKKPRSFSAYDAAKEASLLGLYETMFRGFSLGATHSTLTALDHEFVKRPDGTIEPDFGPSYEQLPWALGLISECLKIGITKMAVALN